MESGAGARLRTVSAARGLVVSGRAGLLAAIFARPVSARTDDFAGVDFAIAAGLAAAGFAVPAPELVAACAGQSAAAHAAAIIAAEWNTFLIVKEGPLRIV
jgi:hypothetical protein